MDSILTSCDATDRNAKKTMRKVFHMSVSRRTLLASLASLGTSQRQAEATIQPADAYELGYGIEIRDFRLFPSPDVMRFIVEIHNANDTPVDTPIVGVTLSHLDAEGNYGWASPTVPVLHPHSSGAVIGVAPSKLVRDTDWGNPTWILCAPLRTQLADKLTPYDIAISHQLAFYDTQSLEIFMWATNQSEDVASNVTITGLLRDKDGRICGITVSRWLQGLEQGNTAELAILISPDEDLNYIANPFTLVDSVEGMSVELSLQPPPSFSSPECAPIMPWNR